MKHSYETTNRSQRSARAKRPLSLILLGQFQRPVIHKGVMWLVSYLGGLVIHYAKRYFLLSVWNLLPPNFFDCSTVLMLKDREEHRFLIYLVCNIHTLCTFIMSPLIHLVFKVNNPKNINLAS